MTMISTNGAAPMKTSDALASLVARVASASGLSRYTWDVRIEDKQPADDKGQERQSLAEVDVYALEARLKFFPEFFKRSTEHRIQTICHEVAHVLVHEYASLAVEFAASKGNVLHPAEERLCDSVGRLIRSAAQEAGVSFEGVG